MLSTVREYALERLVESDEAETTRDRHLTYYLALAEQGDRRVLGPDENHWLNQLDRDIDNFRLAQERAIDRGDGEAEWRFVAALATSWLLRGYYREGMQRIEVALARSYDPDPTLRARFLKGAGQLAQWSGDDERAPAYFEGCLAAAKVAGETALAVHALGQLGYSAYAQGDVTRARARIAEMLPLAREVDSLLDIGLAFVWRVLIAIGPHGTPREREQLRRELDEPVARLRAAQFHRLLSELLAGCAHLLIEVDAAAATAALGEALSLEREFDDPLAISIVPWLALVLVVDQLPAEQVARLTGAMTALQERSAAMGGRMPIEVFGSPQHRLVLIRAIAAARETLGEDAFTVADGIGRSLTFSEFVAELLAVLDVGARALTPLGTGQTRPTDSLISPREREVLALIVAGHSNKEIANALFISPYTVKVHVASLLSKLDAGNRAQLATIAMRRGLVAD
jgi:DNA-binding CsgD family transcriptional regulator